MRHINPSRHPPLLLLRMSSSTLPRRQVSPTSSSSKETTQASSVIRSRARGSKPFSLRPTPPKSMLYFRGKSSRGIFPDAYSRSLILPPHLPRSSSNRKSCSRADRPLSNAHLQSVLLCTPHRRLDCLTTLLMRTRGIRFLVYRNTLQNLSSRICLLLLPENRRMAGRSGSESGRGHSMNARTRAVWMGMTKMKVMRTRKMVDDAGPILRGNRARDDLAHRALHPLPRTRGRNIAAEAFRRQLSRQPLLVCKSTHVRVRRRFSLRRPSRRKNHRHVLLPWGSVLDGTGLRPPPLRPVCIYRCAI